MNTEILNTLKQIREVVSEVQIQLNDSSLTSAERKLLEHVLNNLFDLEDIIIHNSLQAMVDKINESNDALKKLIADMEKSSDKIARFSSTVKKISDVVGILAEITSKALGAGIIG